MRRMPFAPLLVPGIVVLPLVSGRLLDSPAWLKLGLVAVALALPTVVVAFRYTTELDSADPEFLRRRRAAFTLIALLVVSTVWMVGGVDLENEVPLRTLAVVDDEAVRYDLTVALPPGGSLRDLRAVGRGVRAFFPTPGDPRIYRILLSAPPADTDVDILVTWRLPVWRETGAVAVMAVAVAEDG